MTDATDETSDAASVIVARTPVVDTFRAIVGFELVNRPTHNPNSSPQGDPREAVVTASSLLGSVAIDLSAVVGDKLLFCTVDRAVLVSENRLTLPPRKTVLELPVLDVDATLLASIRDYKRDGFTIMLEHSAWGEDTYDLLALADLVKVDLRTGAPGDIMDIVEMYADVPLDLMAAGCDTEADLAWAQAVGFDLFLGRALQANETASDSSGAPLPVSQVQLGMELLSDDLDLDHVEDILRGDPALVMQLLNMASAGAGGGMRRQVRSLREALVVMGTVRLRQWAALVILSRHSGRQSDALVTALVRARMCELLAPGRGIDGPFAFTAGLLSAMNLLLGVPVAEIEQQLELGEDLTNAAFRRQGALGELISRVEHHEQWIDTGSQLSADHHEVTMIGAMAFSWATRYAATMDSAARS